jgi:ribosomal protein L37E
MSETNDRSIQRRDLSDGSSLLVTGYDDDDALSSVERQLRRRVETPTPSEGDSRGGPITRATQRATIWGIQGLRTLGLQSHETADAIRTRRRELYRNEFPQLKPRFVVKCRACGTEFDEDIEECSACGHDEMRRPDPAEKRAAEELFKSVNDAGQSLRDLARYCEPDQWLAGCSLIVIRYEYAIARDSALYDDGEIIAQDPQQLTYGDPRVIVPVVDENRTIGGHWWTCPIHREDPADEPGRCEACGAERREVYFAGKGDDKQYYFRDEVVTWAHPIPRLDGLDGLAPAAAVMLRQVILEMMVRYGAAFYDQESDRLPNQLMVLHTTNPDHWENELARIRDEEDPYDSPILSNQYSPQDSSTPEIQVIDAMPDELLGQSETTKTDFKQDIRQAFDVTDIHDSDLEEAGGLNNEDLQLEVTDRSIAAQQHDYVVGWLDTLAKRLDIEDWYIGFLPATSESDISRTKEAVRTGALAAQAGLDARWEDGELEIADGEFGAPDSEGGPKTRIDDPVENPEDDQSGAGTGDTAPATAQQAYDITAEQADDLLYDAHRHIAWAPTGDVEQQALPFFDDDESVPKFVRRTISEAIDQGALSTSYESIPASARGRLAQVFEENLTQPQGWSLQSLTTDLAEEFGISTQRARTIARSETSSLLNTAREIGYRLRGMLDDEQLFKWVGPEDEATTEACSWLKQQTNPEYGGSPVELSELRELVAEANERFIDHDGRRWTPHIQCRHTYTRDT